MPSAAWNEHTTGEEVAKELQDNIKGKNVLLVGATVKSLGGEFLRNIAPYAKTIWVAGRTVSKLQAAIDEALAGVTGPKPVIHTVQLDMTSFASIRAAAEKINAQEQPIDVLVQNIMVFQDTKLQRTVEGFEAQFGGNHLGTFLLVSLLLPRLRQAGPGARIVAISSEAHKMYDFRWDDPNYELRPEEYEANTAYGHSKFANALFTREIAKRLAGEGILAFTLHPGLIFTNGVEAIDKEVWKKFGVTFLEDGTRVLPDYIPVKNLQEGTATYVAAAFDPTIKDQSGSYLMDSKVRNDELSPKVNDENAARLWKLSEELTGVKLL